jgi:hypothetical protein
MPFSRRVRELDKWLPEKFYVEHLAHFPVPTVDIVVQDPKKRFLLVKRSDNNFTWRGCWATPGGDSIEMRDSEMVHIDYLSVKRG